MTMSKYGNLMLSKVFPGKITPDIDLTDKVVVVCDVPVVKILW